MDIIGFNSIDSYELVDIQEMTDNQIDGQYSSNSTIIRDKYKKAYVFYQRHYVLNIISGCNVTVNGWGVSIGSGQIDINGVIVDVVDTTITITPSTYNIIYVDGAGVLHNIVSTDAIGGYDADIINYNCAMVFVYAGETDIVSIELMEPYSEYICCQVQKLKDNVDPNKPEFEYTDYEWTGIEYRLNTGSNGSVMYISGDDSMYVTYLRDMVTYVRKINLLDNNSFEYISNIYTNDGVIYIDNNLQDGYLSQYSMSMDDTTDISIIDTPLYSSSIPFTKNPHIETSGVNNRPTYSTEPLLTTPFVYGESQNVESITNVVMCDVYDTSGVFVSAVPTLENMTSDLSFHTEFLNIPNWDDGKYFISFPTIETHLVNEVISVDDGKSFVVAKDPLHIDEELYAIDLTYPSKYSIKTETYTYTIKTLEDNQLYSIDDTIDFFEGLYTITMMDESYIGKTAEDNQLYSIDDTIDFFEGLYSISNTYPTYIKEMI